MVSRFVWPVICSLLLAMCCNAQDITVPTEVKGEPGAFIKVPAETKGEIVRWVTLDSGLNIFPVDLLKDSKTLVVTANKAGKYRLLAYTAINNIPSEPALCTVVIGKSPDPTPTPDPTPDPTPAPKGFRVIFVYESSDAMTPAQQAVMFGEKVRNYLDAKTVAGPGGKGWRRFDKDVDVSNERDPELKALWQTARPKVTSVPCVIVAVDGKAEILPLPSNEDAAVELFKKYGG